MKLRGAAFILAIIVTAGTGVFWISQRRIAHATRQPEGSSVTPSGKGHLLSHQSLEIPVRSLTWSRGEDGAAWYVQVTQQNDRQHLLQVGETIASPLQIMQPEDVPAAWFRFAELRNVWPLPDGGLLVHQVSPGFPTQPSLVTLLDPGSRSLRWHVKVPSLDVRFLARPEGGILAFHEPTQGVRLLHLKTRGAATPEIETRLAPNGAEALDIQDLLPLGPDCLLAQGPQGLQSWSVADGWSDPVPAPTSRLTFQKSRGRLINSPEGVYWQPHPGLLFRIRLDQGTPVPDPVKLDFGNGPHAFDRQVLHLLAVDKGGKLWFDLVRPLPAPAGSPQVMDPKDPMALVATGYGDHLAPAQDPTLARLLEDPLDRMYAWKPGQAAPAEFHLASTLPELGLPSGFDPLRIQLIPSMECVAALGSTGAWWVPTGQLPVQPR